MGIFTLYISEFCKSAIWWLSEVHYSDARQLLKIPRRDVRRTRVEGANRRRFMICCPRRGCSAPAGKVVIAPSEPSTRPSVSTESNDEGRGPVVMAQSHFPSYEDFFRSATERPLSSLVSSTPACEGVRRLAPKPNRSRLDRNGTIFFSVSNFADRPATCHSRSLMRIEQTLHPLAKPDQQTKP